MVKNALKTIFLFSIFITSCSTSPTYLRKDIEKAIKDICKNEFNLDVEVWEKGDTIWIYAPFEKILNEKKEIEKEVEENMRRIFLSLKRVILSMDKPPKFYSFVASDTKNIGLDLYYIGFIPDLIKFEMNFISLEDIHQREVFLLFPNPYALGDIKGDHIPKYELTMEEFISYLIKQHLQRKFSSSKINEIRTNYYQGKLEIILDIEIEKDKQIPLPLEEAKRITKKFLNIYRDFIKDLVVIEIKDIFYKKTRIYTKKALLES
jgi:hypothetical protein